MLLIETWYVEDVCKEVGGGRMDGLMLTVKFRPQSESFRDANSNRDAVQSMRM